MAGGEAILFEKTTIISYDEDSRSLKILRDASLLVEDGRITQLVEGSVPHVPDGAEIVDASGKIISPGFINTHHHMWMSAFRTIGANTTLIEYLSGYQSQTGPAGKHFTPDDIYLGQLACALEMIDCGTTTVLDHAHAVFTTQHIDAGVRASFESGLRILFAHTVQNIETTGFTPQMGIAKALELARDPRFRDKANPVELAIAYDGWAFAPPEVNKDFIDMVINHNNSAISKSLAPFSVLTTHMVAGAYPATNSPTLLNSLPTNAVTQPTLTTAAKLPIVFSHASGLTPNDAKLIRSHAHLSISTTPESEAHFGHTSIGAEQCQDCASLGVDTHFTFSAYMPFQARLWLQMQRDQRYRHVLDQNWEIPINNPMDCDSAFLLMTQKGGEALSRPDLGVIRVGAQADLVIFDTTSRAGLWGVRDPVAAVVLHTGGGGDVEAVMVQGKWLKKDHALVDPVAASGQAVSVESIRSRFEQSALRIQKIWETIEPPVFEAGQPGILGAINGLAKTVNVRRNTQS